MTSIVTRSAIGIILVAGITTTAHAEYRCDPAPTFRDRRACEAAQEGPQALRRYLLQMSWHSANMQFSDYVNQAVAERWEELARDEARRQRTQDSQTARADQPVSK